MVEDDNELHLLLRSRLGFSSFRGSQEQAVKAALAGRDCFVLMPTGGGKSLCYTLPALAKPGVVLVISPLIALMENQVEALRSKTIHADLLCSTRTQRDRQAILEDLVSPQPVIRLLYVTPELIATDGFVQTLRKMHVRGTLTLFAVDEVHCISSWGHDFRPAYRRLSSLRRLFPSVPVMALTATAAAKVQEDIVQSLQLKNPLRLVSSFNRPNIHYSVHPLKEAQDAVPAIAKMLKRGASDGEVSDIRSLPCAIVYCLKRDSADDLALRLQTAGLKDSERSRVLAEWTSGRIPVVAATIAFGLGIDKAGVRFVCHVNLPKSIEAFYQESGRAGRDGLPAHSVLFYKEQDRELLSFILGKEEKGRKRKRNPPSAGQPKTSQGQVMRAFNRVVAYCTDQQCRRKILLEHFGERLKAGGCGRCDFCDNPTKVAGQLAELAAESLGTGAKHRQQSKRVRGSYGAASETGIESDSDAEEISSSEGGELTAEQLLAEKIAADARSSGEGIFNALEKAEAKGVQGERKKSKAGKLEREPSEAPPSRIVLGAPPVSEETRSAARARLLKALCGDNVLEAAVDADLVATAQEMEADCFSSSASKSVYLSKLAAASRTASNARSANLDKAQSARLSGAQLQELPASSARSVNLDKSQSASLSGAELQEQENQSGIDQGPAANLTEAKMSYRRDYTAGPEETELEPEAEVGANPATADDMVAEIRCAVTSAEAAIGAPLGSTAEKGCLSVLERLKAAEVTAEMLREGNIGRRVRALGKSGNHNIATGAKKVVAIWKQKLLRRM